MIFDILNHTPVWVFGILVALVVLGARRIRTSDVPRGQVVVVPIVMTAFSLFGLTHAFGFASAAGLAWVVAYAAPLALAWRMTPRSDVQYSPATGRFRVPGSWVPLILMMTIFFTRYAVAVALAMHPALDHELGFTLLVGAVYGLSSGCFAARALTTLRSGRRAGPSFAVA